MTQDARPFPEGQAARRTLIASAEALEEAVRNGPVTGARIACPQMSGIHCEEALFEDCEFATTFSTGDFSRARFVNCEFTNCRFSNSDFEETVFKSCRFFDTGSKTGCQFAFSGMEKAEFMSCNLASTKFDTCNLFLATFTECSMRGLEMKHVDFSRTYGRKNMVNKVRFATCGLNYAELSETSFRDCELVDCIFTEANLTRCDFSGADMRRSVIRMCDLDQANFSNADLRQGQLEGVILYELADYRGLRVSEDQQQILLHGLGILVTAE